MFTRSSDSLVLSIPYVWTSLSKRAFSVIGQRLWNSLPPVNCYSATNSFVSSKLDYCNSLYSGISQTNNTAHSKYSGLCCYKHIKKFEHITPIYSKNYTGFLSKKHWLQTLSSYKQNFSTITSLQPLSLHSLSFLSHFLFTRSIDSSVPSIPYVSQLHKHCFPVQLS